MSEPGKPSVITIPNALSFYRLLSFPFLLFLVFTHREHWFSILFCINLVTDILDGLIARLFRMTTALGAKLDSLADAGMYILAFFGIIVFKTSVLGNDMLWLYFFLGMWLSGILLSLIRFGKFPTLHLYSAKISGYLQGIFFFILFSYGYSRGLFFTAIVWAILSGIEEMWVLLSLKELRSDVKGIWWLKKENKKSRMD